VLSVSFEYLLRREHTSSETLISSEVILKAKLEIAAASRVNVSEIGISHLIHQLTGS